MSAASLPRTETERNAPTLNNAASCHTIIRNINARIIIINNIIIIIITIIIVIVIITIIIITVIITITTIITTIVTISTTIITTMLTTTTIITIIFTSRVGVFGCIYSLGAYLHRHQFIYIYICTRMFIYVW